MRKMANKGEKTSASFTPHDRKKGTPKVFKNIGWYFAVLIVVLLIVIMAIPSFGIFSRNAAGEEYVFGKFGNNDIKFASGSYMANAYSSILQQYSQYFNQEQISSMQMQIMQQAFQNAATATAYDYYASKFKFNITEDETDDFIRENYINDRGEFNSSSWKNLSATERARIRENVKNNLIGERLRDLYTSSPISDAEVEALRTYQQSEKEKDFQEQQEKDSREGIETEENKAELVDVTNDEVITSIRNGSADRFYDSVLKSNLFVDNFSETYTTKILPLMLTDEEGVSSRIDSDNTTIEDAVVDAQDTTEVVQDTAVNIHDTPEVVQDTVVDAPDTTLNVSENTPLVNETVSENIEDTLSNDLINSVVEPPQADVPIAETTTVAIEPILTESPAPVPNEIIVGEEVISTPDDNTITTSDNTYDSVDFVLSNGESGDVNINDNEKIDFTLRNSEGGVKGIDNTVEFTLE